MLLGIALPATESQLKPADANLVNKASNEVFTWENVDGKLNLIYTWNQPATVYSVNMLEGQKILPGRQVLVLNIKGRSKATVEITEAMEVIKLNDKLRSANTLEPGDVIMTVQPKKLFQDSISKDESSEEGLPGWGVMFSKLWESTGIADIIRQTSADPLHTWHLGIGRVLMMLVGMLLIGLAVFKGYEPLLLLPIGFGAILANIPIVEMTGPDGMLGMVYSVGIETGVFPLIIFMGVGAMTDFGPLIANPKTALLGAAAQFGIFAALLGALLLTKWVPGIEFDLKDAASIGIIGGADGPTSIYLTSKLAPALLGPIAVAAYSYMALVPIIQPPIMRLLTTKEERKIKMKQLRHVSKLEKICFPLIITLLCAFWLPDAAPLIGMLMLGNLMRESGVVDRLSDTAQNALINIVTIFLGLTVGSKLSADKFLNFETLGILLLGLVAFCIGTAAGVIFAKLMNKSSKNPINPLIGAAGVSAVPMAARVVNKVGLEDDPHNFLLMHAMGPNVAGVIGSAVAAGALLCFLAK
jgi:oxaloacetate decarboxylase beta subunit